MSAGVVLSKGGAVGPLLMGHDPTPTWTAAHPPLANAAQSGWGGQMLERWEQPVGLANNREAPAGAVAQPSRLRTDSA